MDIKEIALKVARKVDPDFHGLPSDRAACEFAEALIESYKAELLKEVWEPVLYAEFAEDGGWLGDASEYADHLEEPHALFTSDQVAAAIIKAEQRVSESCAALCDHLQTIQQFGENGYGCEAAITRGEWRKFVKEV